MTGREWGLMGVLAILWGVSFFFSKVALAELPPFTLVLGRFGIAALALLVAARLGGHRIPRSPRVWAGFFVLGALNSFIPFGLIAWGQVQLTSGLASILNATTPLFTALVAHAWGDERLTPNRIAGVLVGLAGVCVADRPRRARAPGRAHAGRAGDPGRGGLVRLRGQLWPALPRAAAGRRGGRHDEHRRAHGAAGRAGGGSAVDASRGRADLGRAARAWRCSAPRSAS